MFEISESLIDSVLAELRESESVAYICFLFLRCEILIDQFVENGESVEVGLLLFTQM